MHAYLGGGKSSHCVRNKSEEFGVCVDTEREKMGQRCFHHQVTVVSFLSPPQDFSLFGFGKEISFLLFLPAVLFDDVISCFGGRDLKNLSKKSHPQTQQKEGKSTHFVVLSVVSRSPGKLFKRTLTYCGKCTHGYVKREREKKKQAHFLLRLTRVLALTLGEKVARRRKEF